MDKKDKTIHLTVDDLKEIILDFLQKNGYPKTIKENDINFSVSSYVKGPAWAECQVMYLNGCNIRYK